MKKMNPELLDTYSEVVITENLPSGIKIMKHFQKIEDEPNFWKKYFSTNSQLPFCPYDGDFHQCPTCEWYSGTRCENCHEELSLTETFLEISDALSAGYRIRLF